MELDLIFSKIKVLGWEGATAAKCPLKPEGGAWATQAPYTCGLSVGETTGIHFATEVELRSEILRFSCI